MGKFVLVTREEENICGECWARLEQEYPDVAMALRKATGDTPVLAPRESIRRCEHGAPDYAQSIVLAREPEIIRQVRLADGEAVEAAVVDDNLGETADADGYLEPTHNCYAWAGYEIGEDGDPTGCIIFAAGDGGEGVAFRFTLAVFPRGIPERAVKNWLLCWEDGWIEKFRAERIL